MENKYKITIPEPCHENWDEMTPRENGRFCMSCSKTVVDFTSMLPDEIQHGRSRFLPILLRLYQMQLDAEVKEIAQRAEATKNKDEYLRREIEWLVLDKQRAELTRLIREADEDKR